MGQSSERNHMKKNHSVTGFDRGTCRDVASKIEAALAPLASELGIKISTMGGRFTEATYTLKVECATISGGEVQTKTVQDFKTYAFRYGLSADDLGRIFIYSGERWKIVGMKPRARKYPILCEKGGKVYKLPAESVRSSLALGGPLRGAR